ncbi:hypothetical protein D3C80_1691640 [compost metagenome]
MGPRHQMYKRQVVQRIYQVNVFESREQTVHWLSNVGIQMNGIDNIDIRMLMSDLHQCLADPFKATAKAFSSMASH